MIGVYVKGVDDIIWKGEYRDIPYHLTEVYGHAKHHTINVAGCITSSRQLRIRRQHNTKLTIVIGDSHWRPSHNGQTSWFLEHVPEGCNI